MKYLVGGIFLLLSTVIHAQSYEAGVWAGGVNYFGDINSNSSVFDARPSGGIVGRYNFDSRIAARFSAGYGRTSDQDRKLGDTDYQLNRNEAVRTKTLNLSAMMEFNFFSFNTTEAFLDPQPYTPFLAAGIGFSSISPEVFFRDEGWTDVSSIRTEDNKDFSKANISVPLAGGVKYQLNDDFVLTGEWASHILFTDYFDDLSTTYNQLSIDQNIGTLNTVGRQRGDRFKNDTYNMFGLQLTYVIPIYSCPGD